jgi:hypothetical protein
LAKSRLVADDFETLRNRLAKQSGPHRLGTTIQCLRCAFKYAYESGLSDRPMHFGPGFHRPSKKVMRTERAKQGPKLFSAEEFRAVIAAAPQPLKAMILLGINCGYGNADCGTLW